VNVRTQVAIIGAGPAGLLLARLLRMSGIESVVLESRTRDYIENRIRAGVLEHQSVDILKEAGVGERMRRQGMVHKGIELRFDGRGHRIDFEELTGKGVMVYAQHEVVKDLVANRLADNQPLLFEAEGIAIEELDTKRPSVRFRQGGRDQKLDADFIAGCDGFHGITRPAIPASVLTEFERIYPFAWLGILAEAPPKHEELIYALHDNGFALFSMRSPTVTRLYLQCRPDEDLKEWPDDRIWSELRTRLSGADGFEPAEGPIMQKSVTAMRSFVAEPMQYGRLFLAGDAAHIVPPTGAKGMNLAFTDVRLLARALETYYDHGSEDKLNRYSETNLRRIWKVQRFSWWMTQLLHKFDDANPFDQRRQRAELDYITSSRTGAKMLAENYVGLPLDDY
jgi:p-hydroxybenzoate 3-monooxygenase